MLASGRSIMRNSAHSGSVDNAERIRQQSEKRGKLWA